MLKVTDHAALDAVAVPVAAEVAFYGLAPIGLGRDERLDPAHQQVYTDRIAVISFVFQQSLGLVDWQRHQIIDRPVVRGLAAGQDEAGGRP